MKRGADSVRVPNLVAELHDELHPAQSRQLALLIRIVSKSSLGKHSFRYELGPSRGVQD
jgi:hypothetical protein